MLGHDILIDDSCAVGGERLRGGHKVARQAQVVDKQHVALNACGLQRRVAHRTRRDGSGRKLGRDAGLLAAFLFA